MVKRGAGLFSGLAKKAGQKLFEHAASQVSDPNSLLRTKGVEAAKALALKALSGSGKGKKHHWHTVPVKSHRRRVHKH